MPLLSWVTVITERCMVSVAVVEIIIIVAQHSFGWCDILVDRAELMSLMITI